MIISHNIFAANAQRQYKVTTDRKAKSAEKLSSGYRINRAADDAAGLCISEEMRRQIRGLNRGTDNIGEGISLIQTADGALDEVIANLQRIRELSIQSYNETNSRSDIKAMQDEVDQLLTEIERTGITTTFNSKHILQGNEIVYLGKSQDMEMLVERTVTETRDLPAWLTDASDSKVEPHPAYNKNQTGAEGVMYQSLADGTMIYYGPRISNPEYQATWYGDTPEGIAAGYTGWSDTIGDNPSAKLDFSGIANNTNSEDLYQDLFDLLGGSIAYPCGTCSNELKGIRFNGNVDGFSITSFQGRLGEYAYINLSNLDSPFTFQGKDYTNYFDALSDVMDDEDLNPNKPGADKEQQVKDLAETIAKDLTARAYNGLNRVMSDHFDRVLMNDDTSLIVYDYRDTSALTNVNAANTNIVAWGGSVTHTEKFPDTVPGQDMYAEQMVHIAAGSDSENSLWITLPNISLDELHIRNYHLGNQYDQVISYEYTKDSQEQYAKAKEQYEKDYDVYKNELEKWHQNDKTETKSETVTVTRTVIDHWDRIDGERRPVYRKETSTQTVQYTVTTNDQPRPNVPKEPTPEQFAKKLVTKVAKSDTLDPIDYAISRVSQMRSILGAQQNRLEHAYQINTSTSENTQYAESRIRDTDMAEEMCTYSLTGILAQAGEAMIAQANQMNQRVLELLG